MKFLILLLIPFLISCDEKEPTKKEAELSKEIIERKLESMYQEVLACDLLAKCMGYEKGEINSHNVILMRHSRGQGYPDYVWNPEGSFTCKLKGKDPNDPYNNLTLDSIGPMLRGCQAKKCSEKECKNEK